MIAETSRTAACGQVRKTLIKLLFFLWKMERAKGIEPSYAAWEAAVLPLNYARVSHHIAS